MAEDFNAWVGRKETATDVASPGAYERLSGLLDHKAPPWRVGEAPPLGHWLNFLPAAQESNIGADGHPQRGGFLPPVNLPRRMWAGGRLSFHASILLGSDIFRISTIKSVEPKSGRSGDMVFVTVEHLIYANGVLAVSEEQDIVYREAPKGPAPPQPPQAEVPLEADWSRTIIPDPVLLFRYSALTYNAHRIHYDRDFATTVEGYAGLVVHGPFLATMLLDHYVRRFPQSRIAHFSFRAQRPLFDTSDFILSGRHSDGGAALWAATMDGHVAVHAQLLAS